MLCRLAAGVAWCPMGCEWWHLKLGLLYATQANEAASNLSKNSELAECNCSDPVWRIVTT